MKATGIVRRIDELGRVVIPKEIRRTLRIREGDPLEIYTDRDGEIILKKYSPISELEDFAKEYADSLHQAVGHICMISDKDTFIAVSGANKKDYLDKMISPELENIIESRKPVVPNIAAGHDPLKLVVGDKEAVQYKAMTIVPIISSGDAIGSVVLVSKDNNTQMGDVELKVAEAAAGFVGRQIEQ